MSDDQPPASPWAEIIRRCVTCEDPSGCGINECHLSVSSRTPEASRAFTRAALTGTSLSGPVADDVVLVVNELTTASYLAGARTINLGIEVHQHHVTVIVRDDLVEPALLDGTRAMLIGAVTSGHEIHADDAGTVNVARISNGRPPLRVVGRGGSNSAPDGDRMTLICPHCGHIESLADPRYPRDHAEHAAQTGMRDHIAREHRQPRR